MKRVFRVAQSCIGGAVRGFHWREYAPIGWIAAAHALVAVLTLLMESIIGMGTIGAAAKAFFGEGVVHYPAFFLYMPAIAGIAEAFLYTVPAAVLIPLMLIRVLARLEGRELASSDVAARLKSAWKPVLLALIANVAVLTAWQWALDRTVAPFLRSMLPGTLGGAADWFLTVLGAYAIAACLVYVPIVAVRSTGGVGAVLRDGVHAGIALFSYTYTILFVVGLVSLPLVFLIQTRSPMIVRSLRPELLGWIVLVHAILISVVTYVSYAAVARLHEGEEVEVEA